MTTPIQPTAVYPPGYIPPPDPGGPTPAVVTNAQPPGPGSYIRRGTGGIYRWASSSQLQVDIPRPLPTWLGNKRLLFVTWFASIGLVAFDEWKNYGIMPRPQRLWDTSIVYGLLMMLSSVDVMVPIANAFGIGFTMTLYYQYYGKSGQFSKPAATSGGGGGGKVVAQ